MLASVKGALLSLQGSVVGKRRKKAWRAAPAAPAAPLCIFWNFWKQINNRSFEDVERTD